MVACTFSGVTVPVSRVEKINAKGAYTFEASCRCRTPTYSIITSLQALRGHIGIQVLLSGKTRIQTTGGTKGSLVLNGVTYPNCYIADFEDPHEVPNSLPFTEWEFTVSFVQETI
jgi:hypothetical protein